MKRSQVKWGMLLVVASVIGLTSCAAGTVDQTPQEEAAKETGKLELNLTTTTPDGVQYRLSNAIIMVQGPSNTLFYDTEEDPSQTVWHASVPPGDYFYFLQEGWQMERTGLNGVSETVGAVLDSPNPGDFVVSSNGTTGVPLRFRVGDGVVSNGSFEVSIEVVEENSPGGYCTSNDECEAGETCCSGGFLGQCLTLEEGSECPLPDLIVVEETATNSLFISRETFAPDSCALAEECVGGPGERRLLKFSTETANVGPMDVILGNPTEDQGFEFSSCHGHYHFEGYAQYQLKNDAGYVVATGHKQAFCLLDSTQIQGNRSPQFHCGFQGITSGWADIYGAGLDCQWVDITDVPNGDYVLSISINPEQTIAESNYDNNVVNIPVTIGDDPAVTDPCTQTGPGRNCGWNIDENYVGVSCEPGTSLSASCCDCEGDTVIRACEGETSCTAGSALGNNDDGCDLCSALNFTCPESGVFTLLTGAFGGGETYTCNLELLGASSAPAVDAGL
jgi:hypothetical protein